MSCSQSYSTVTIYDRDLVKLPVLVVTVLRVREPPCVFVDDLIVPELCFFLGPYFVAILFPERNLFVH